MQKKRKIKYLKINNKILSLSLLLSLMVPINIRRDDIIFTNESAYENLYEDDYYGNSVVFFDAYTDSKEKLKNNYKTLIIRNSSLLTEDENNLISDNKNLKNLVITYNFLDINNENIDISFLNDDVNINLIFDEDIRNNKTNRELYEFLIYKKSKDYKKENYNYNIFLLENIGDKEKQKYDLLDNYFMEITNDFKIKNIENDYNKILEIENYVINNLDYDKNITYKKKDYERKIDYYNEHVLSFLLNNQESNQKLGVCCNFAALSTVLGYYLDVDLNYIVGKVRKKSYGHAWNEFYEDNKTLILDATAFENDFLFKKLNDAYTNLDNNNEDICYEVVCENIVDNISYEKSTYDKKYDVYNEYTVGYDISEKEKHLRLRITKLYFCVSLLLLYTIYLNNNEIKRLKKNK